MSALQVMLERIESPLGSSYAFLKAVNCVFEDLAGAGEFRISTRHVNHTAKVVVVRRAVEPEQPSRLRLDTRRRVWISMFVI